jgi:hypothetical protein
MIERRRYVLSVLSPILAGFVLIGSTTFASSKKNNPGTATTQSTDAAASTNKTTSGKKSENSAPTEAKAGPTHTTVSASEIASAKSKGLVWVNTDSKVYHKNGRYYGHTKQGKFMTEADAQKAGYKAAKR